MKHPIITMNLIICVNSNHKNRYQYSEILYEMSYLFFILLYTKNLLTHLLGDGKISYVNLITLLYYAIYLYVVHDILTDYLKVRSEVSSLFALSCGLFANF